MSKLEVNKKDKKGYIREGVFAYVKVQTPVNKYQSTTEKEYTVDLVVDEDTADAWEAAFPKNGYTKIKTSEFKDKFKIDPVFPDAKNQYVIKVKAGAQFKGDWKEFKTGELLPYSFKGRPKIYIPDGDGVKDITLDTLVANGSKGDASFGINTNQFGDFPQLTAILVKDLIEYKSEGATSDFGKVTNTVHQDDAPQSSSGGSIEGSFDPDVSSDPDPF